MIVGAAREDGIEPADVVGRGHNTHLENAIAHCECERFSS